MASWLVKALVQRSISALPNPHFWNELFQDRVTHSLGLTDQLFEYGLQHCHQYLDQLRRRKPAIQNGFSAFELGTGWYPVVPIGLFLCGARQVWTWDIVRHLKLDRLKLTIARFLELDRRRKLQDHLSPVPERLRLLRELMTRCELPKRLEPAELLDPLGIHYRLGNAAQSELPPQSMDLILSNGVFEYLSPQTLSEIMKEFHRIAAPDAIMSHTIDLADQYASFDSGITHFNFLRFPDRLWKCLNNPIIPLNRLRISDYRRVFEENGFQIVDETNRQGNPADLARTPLSERFRNYSLEDLLVLHSELIAIPRRSVSRSRAASAGH